MSRKENAKSLTGEKLDWLKAIRANKHVGHAAYRLASYIAELLNTTSPNVTYVSDQTISEEIPGFSRSTVRRCREELEAAGFVKCAPGRWGTATRYMVLHDNVEDAALDRLDRKDARDARKLLRDEARLDRIREARQGRSEPPEAGCHSAPNLAQRAAS